MQSQILLKHNTKEAVVLITAGLLIVETADILFVLTEQEAQAADADNPPFGGLTNPIGQ